MHKLNCIIFFDKSNAVANPTQMYTFITLKQLREIRNYTQSFVASKIGVTQSAYSKIENFSCQTSIDNYKKIADLLNVDVDQVLSNRIQALIHIKSSTTKDELVDNNLPNIMQIINTIKEQEFLLNRIIHQSDVA